MKKIALYFFLFLAFLSCNEASDPEENLREGVLVLGLTYGECGGDCAHLFKLDESSLFQDDESGYWWTGQGAPAFQAEALDNTAALIEMQSLLTDFPNYLLETTEERFGCPDCADGGAIHVMREVDGKEMWWTLDTEIKSNPEELQEWTSKVHEFLIDLAF